MQFRFRPAGHLNIETDPTILPESGDGRVVVSGDMTQCINLRVDRPGQLSTRYGSTRRATATTTGASRIVEQEGSRYVFAGNKVYAAEALIKTATASAAWTLTQYRYVLEAEDNIYATNGTDKYRINGTSVEGWGLAAPAAPTVTPTGSGTAYDVKITWARLVGGTVVAESNASPVTATSAGASINVTESAAPTDTQITHFRTYVSAAGGGITYLAETTAVGGTATVSLPATAGTAAPTDHDILPNGVTCLSAPSNGYVFAGVGHLLYFCKRTQPEYWPTTYYIEVGAPQFPIVAVLEWNTSIFIVTTIGIWQLYGNDPDTFYARELKTKAGALSEMGVCAVSGYGLFHIDTDGLYVWDGATDVRYDARLGSIWRGESVGNIPGANRSAMVTAWALVFQDKLYLAYPSGSETYPSRVLALSFADGRAAVYDYPANYLCSCVDRSADVMLAVDSSGYVWTLEARAATADNSTAIAWEVESKHFADNLARFFPRQARYDVTLEAGATATGTIKLDGVAAQTHTLAIANNRDITKRLVSPCNGQRLALNITGTGSATIYGMEVS